MNRFLVPAAVVLGVAVSARPTVAENGTSGQAALQPEAAIPEKYLLDYPPAEQFCPPVQTFFYEVVRTFEVVRGRQFTHQPNGGYGLPVVQKVDGSHLLHLGADVGWYRVGEPVYAVAAGVVRASDGPSPDEDDRRPGTGERAGRQRSGRQPMLHWGNVITIEHRLPDGDYFTTVYGHLGSDRLVSAGDVVEAGQQIGTIGRKHALVNGGYDTHVHFAVRQGRLAEPGCTLFALEIDGRPGSVKLVALGEEEIEVEMPAAVPLSSINLAGHVYPITRREERYFIPAQMLWGLKQRPGFEIVGYGLTTEGWQDPVAFLRQHGADRNPAPFRGSKTPPAAKKGRHK